MKTFNLTAFKLQPSCFPIIFLKFSETYFQKHLSEQLLCIKGYSESVTKKPEYCCYQFTVGDFNYSISNYVERWYHMRRNVGVTWINFNMSFTAWKMSKCGPEISEYLDFSQTVCQKVMINLSKSSRLFNYLHCIFNMLWLPRHKFHLSKFYV